MRVRGTEPRVADGPCREQGGDGGGAPAGAGRAPRRSKGALSLDLDPDDMRRGFGRLVLTVVELLRELLERQAIRRMEAGSLGDAEVEKLSRSFEALDREMDALVAHFGLSRDDLNADLGPLGRLM